MGRKITQEEFNLLIKAWSQDNVLGIESLFNVQLTDQQKELVRNAQDPKARVAVSSCTGSGKALANYEKIHTPSGLKPIGDITVGELVCNSYGSYSKVTGVYPQGLKDCYRVHFNNNTYVDCDLNHLWTVSSYHSHTGFVTLTLEEILNRGIYVEIKPTERAPQSKRLKYYLPNIQPIYKEKKELPLDPYTLGVWLGDGCRKTGRVSNIDQDLWDKIEDNGHKLGRSIQQARVVYGLIKHLKTLRISERYSFEKSIPRDYLESSIEDRFELLRGLMDTDGTISEKGNATYYTTSKDLAEDFIYLIRSLGGMTRQINIKKTTHRDCFVIHFQINTTDKLFHIQRKQDRFINTKINSSRVYISSVEYLGKVEATCITIDSTDKLFICENFIPTHNSATLSMLTFLYLMTLPDCRVLITSPSYSQLVRVFYSEIIKWHRRMPEQFQGFFNITKEKVEYTNTSRYLQIANLVTASVENKESLQGGHAENYIILGDEASGISEEAFDILLGTLSTGKGGRFVLASNPVRSSGRFYEIFNRDLGTWKKLFFSAHDSPNVNKEWIQEMEETYGIDSDLYRMRVLGQFPRIGVAQFISSDIVEECLQNTLHLSHYNNFPKVMGVDIARFGDDSTVFITRQGPKLVDFKVFKGLDTMEVASKVAEYDAIHHHSRIYIDSIGVGAGTFDRCKQLGLRVSEVIVSNKSTEPNIYSNLRSQLWGKMREWLQNGADLPYISKEKETNLATQLTSMEFAYNNKMQIQLLSKKELKRMGHPSPDIADALSLTFADQAYEGRARAFLKRPIKQPRFMWT